MKLLDYDPKDGFADFRAWVLDCGGHLLAPTNPYEIFRIKTDQGVIIGHKNKKRKFTYCQRGAELVEKFHKRQAISLTVGKWTKSMKRKRHLMAMCVERDGLACFYCAAELAPLDSEDDPRPKATHEHFIPISKSGPDNLSNSLLACERCNTEADRMDGVEKIKLRDRKRRFQFIGEPVYEYAVTK